jgi:AraC-like DNA-binding protein
MTEQSDLEQMNGFLKEKILHYLPEEGHFQTSIPGLGFIRRDGSVEKEKCFYSPGIAVVVQGSKHLIIGNEEYHYGKGDCIVAGMDLPAVNTVIQASVKAPLLSFYLNLDWYLISQLLLEIGNNNDTVSTDSRMVVSLAKVDSNVLDAFIRLINLLETPIQISILAPLIVREIYYRLLTGSQSGVLRTVGTLGTQSNRIAEAITWLRNNYVIPFQIDSLAAKVNMSIPTFNRYFRQSTSLSPLQFQKRLRLCEAQRLMLTDSMDATHAAYSVGYVSINQFNREYKRVFGEPPRRDVNKKQVAT